MHSPDSPCDSQNRRGASKLELDKRLLFDIWNPCFEKGTFGRILFIMTKPHSNIFIRRIKELNGESTMIDLISVQEVPAELKQLCKNIFVYKDGVFPDRRAVKPKEVPFLDEDYDAIFLDYHVWEQPRENINRHLIFLFFRAKNIYYIDSAFTVRDYHDFEHLYIETRLEEEVKISACGIMRAEFCKEFYQSAKIYGKKGGILNIGTYLGRSAIAFALGSKAVGGRKVIAVDPILPEEFYDNVKKNGVSDYIIPFEMPSEELYNSWPKLMKERQELELGLVFVDGAHGYGQASFDISRWEEYLVSGGLMLIDDYERAEPDVLRAVYEYVVCSGKFKSISMPIDRLVKAEKR